MISLHSKDGVSPCLCASMVNRIFFDPLTWRSRQYRLEIRMHPVLARSQIH
jgi:hypothetical protein